MSYSNPLSSSDQPRRIQNLGGGRPPDRRPVKQAGVYGTSPPPTPPPPEDEDADKLKRAIAIHNEQVKLASTAINNSSINLITAGIIVPFVAMGFEFTTAPPATQITLVTIGAWGVVAYILRAWAHSNMERMR